jgi:hypothetical protein
MSRTEKFIRTPTCASGPLTDDEKLRMAEHTQLWIDRIMRTAPIDPGRIIPAIEALYAAAKLKKPRIVIVPSPVVMAFAGGAAAWLWHCRKNRDATGDATGAATWDATRDATGDATDWPARACSAIAGDGGIACAKLWHNFYSGGNMWAQYDAFLTAARDILGLRLPQHDVYSAWEECAIEGGFRLMHEEFCMVSDFPKTLEKDERNRPHCDNGPSHEWRDGWQLWHIHGVRVTEQVVLRPETLTVAQISEETNVEVRRVMIDRFGADRYIRESGLSPIDECPADHPMVGLRGAKLYIKELDGDEPIMMLDMLNSTPEPDGSAKRYRIRVDPNAYGGVRDCLGAMASTYRMPNGSMLFARPQDYAPVAES